MRRSQLVLLGCFFLAASACTPAASRGYSDTPEAAPFDQAIEVVSTATFPIVVKYMMPGGSGSTYLGTVSPNSRATFVLPAQRIHIIAETEDGRAIAGEYSRSRLVTFRRVQQ